MKSPALLLGAALVLAGQVQAPLVRVAARLVEVNVIVRNKSGPIRNLTKEDFTILDEGKPRSIAFLSSNSIDAHAKDDAPPEPGVFANGPHRQTAATSATVVLLDGVNTLIADQIYSKKQFIQFLSQIQPSDRIAVYALGRQLRVLNDFTSDAARLVASLKRYSGEIGNSPDTYVPDDFDTGDAKLDAVWNEFQHMNESRVVEARVELTIEAMEAIANHIGRLPGRKNLIWVSSSFPFVINDGPGSGMAPRMFAREINRAALALNRANIAVYPVDARGLVAMPQFFAGSGRPPAATAGAPTGQETMRMVAQATGGRAFMNNNDIRGAIRSVMNDSDFTYTLAFYPDTSTLNESKFRRIKVKVNRPGVEVRCREGYVPSALLASGGADRVTAIREAIWSPLEAWGIGLRVQISKGEGTAQPVSLTATVSAADLELTVNKGRRSGTIEAVFSMRSTDGKDLSTSSHILQLEMDQTSFDKALSEGLKIHKTIGLAAGAVELKVIGFDPVSGKLGSVIVPLNGALKQ